MIWTKYTIKTITDAADLVASILFENGIIGAEITDSTNLSSEDLKKMYVDIPVMKVDDGIARVSFYVAIVDSDENKIEYNERLAKEKNSPANATNKNLVDDSYKPSTDNNFTTAAFEKIFTSIKERLGDLSAFTNLGELSITTENLDDKIFLNKWKENFKRLDLGEIMICPSWEKDKEGDICIGKKKIFIEPGNAFGTGQHDTTKLCVDAIEKLIDEKKIDIGNDSCSILDIGCGSGILGLVGATLGIKNVTLVDVDKDVEFNLKENFKLNGYEGLTKLSGTGDDKCPGESESIINCDVSIEKANDKNIKYCFGNVIDDESLQMAVGFEKHDIVVANILAPVICSLLGVGRVDRFIKPGGYFICSGILNEKAKDVEAAIRQNGRFPDWKIKQTAEWTCIICHKNA